MKMIGYDIKVRLGLAKPSVLVRFLMSPDSETRWDAADWLYTYRDQELVVPVFEVLQKETDPHVRKRLIWILETNKAWNELFTCLDSPEFDMRWNAASALTHCGETRFVEPLLKKMREGNNQDQIYRIILMGIVKTSSVGLLLEYLSDATPAMKRALLHLLGVTKDRQVLGYLLAGLRDPNVEVREGAVLGLMHLGDPQAIEPLRELLNDPAKDIQDWAKTAIRELSKPSQF